MDRKSFSPPRRSAAPGRRPDYVVSALDKATEVKGQIGVAWVQDGGRISIKLNPFVVLDTFKQDLVISLFPNDRDGPAPYAEPAGSSDAGPARPGGAEPPY